MLSLFIYCFSDQQALAQYLLPCRNRQYGRTRLVAPIVPSKHAAHPGEMKMAQEQAKEKGTVYDWEDIDGVRAATATELVGAAGRSCRTAVAAEPVAAGAAIAAAGRSCHTLAAAEPAGAAAVAVVCRFSRRGQFSCRGRHRSSV